MLRRVVIGVLAPVFALAACGSAHEPSARGPAGAEQRSAAAQPSRCSPNAIRLALGEQFSPQTGEHGRLLVLVNRGTATCRLDGTPRVALYRGRGALPFVYRSSAGNAVPRYSSSEAAHAVLLRPGASAYFLVAKYRCDAGGLAEASGVSVRLPGRPRQLRLALPEGGGGFGVNALVYCRSFLGERSLSPGNYVDVSAISASEQETFGKPAYETSGKRG